MGYQFPRPKGEMPPYRGPGSHECSCPLGVNCGSSDQVVVQVCMECRHVNPVIVSFGEYNSICSKTVAGICHDCQKDENGMRRRDREDEAWLEQRRDVERHNRSVYLERRRYALLSWGTILILAAWAWSVHNPEHPIMFVSLSTLSGWMIHHSIRQHYRTLHIEEILER